MHTFVISIKNPTPLKSGAPQCTDYRHSKYVKRRQYVENTLVPKCRELWNSVEIFDAVTDEHFTAEYSDTNTVVTFNGDKFRIGSGSTGNFLSHYSLWQKCVALNSPLLILEDDAELPEQDVQKMQLFSALQDFCHNGGDKDVLYLQSESPCAQKVIKDYDQANLVPYTPHLYNLLATSDLSGTAAYAIKPGAAQALIMRAKECKTAATDEFMHRSFMEHRHQVLVPKIYTQCFMLHEVWAPWNHIHQNDQ